MSVQSRSAPFECAALPENDATDDPGDQKTNGNRPKKVAELLALQVWLEPREQPAPKPGGFGLRHIPSYNRTSPAVNRMESIYAPAYCDLHQIFSQQCTKPERIPPWRNRRGFRLSRLEMEAGPMGNREMNLPNGKARKGRASERERVGYTN